MHGTARQFVERVGVNVHPEPTVRPAIAHEVRDGLAGGRVESMGLYLHAFIDSDADQPSSASRSMI